MGKIILISTSLSENSRSALLVQAAAEQLEKAGKTAEVIDLRKVTIPFCDGRALEDYPAEVQSLYKSIEEADAIVFGFPIYCYSISGVLKNFIDVFSYAMKGKRFGVCAAAGSKLSYLAIADLHKIMHFQSNATVVHPAVVADYADFEDNNANAEIQERIQRMLAEL